jgi:hyperosmotically inducible periplasmic protein
MKNLLLSAVIAAAAAGAPALYAAQPADSDTAHAAAIVKDSVITTKVKAKLAEKHLSTLTEVSVDTDNAGEVWLSGKVPTKDAKDLAGLIARDTDGVTAVHNKIVVTGGNS